MKEALIFFLGKLLDLGTTKIALDNGGVEMNPLMSGAFLKFGYTGVLFFYLLAAVFVGLAVKRYGESKLFTIAVWIFISLGFFTSLINLTGIIIS